MLKDRSNAYLAIDMDTGFTVGGNVADAVAAGTPIIGCNSDCQTKLLPELAIDELDYGRAEELATHLIRDAEYFKDQVQQGRRRLEEFSHENTWRRFYRLINAYKNR